jgi:serine-type D-Ala-D-Ala carboxypeptidase (penicillin-binding protein 5/6)
MPLFRRLVALLLVLAIICPSDAFAKRHRHKKKKYRTPVATAASAMLLDVSSNRVLYAKNIDRRVFPASTTKVMTAILALELLPLNKYVTVGPRALLVPETKLSLRAGEQYMVKDLLYAALLKSANDAVVVLAEAMAGSQSQFVVMMNEKARDVGAHNTRFANAHGLPSPGAQYTTARDMAAIYRAALKYPVFREIISYKFHIMYSKDGRRFFLKSHNKSLFLNWKRNIYGKTGFTQQAQSCFVGYYRKGQSTYIVDIFGSRKRWEDIKFIVERYGQVDL